MSKIQPQHHERVFPNPDDVDWSRGDEDHCRGLLDLVCHVAKRDGVFETNAQHLLEHDESDVSDRQHGQRH